jgi:hypothetical protein
MKGFLIGKSYSHLGSKRFNLCKRLRFFWALVIHPSLHVPGVLRHSDKLWTLPQDTSLRECVKKICWTSLAHWWQRQCVIIRSEVGSHQCKHCQRQTIAARLCLLKRTGKQLPPIGCLHVRQLALIWGRCLQWCSGEKLAADRNHQVFGMWW